MDDNDDQDDDDNDNDHDHLHDDDDDDDDEDDLPGAFPMPPSSHESLRKKASTTMIINKTATSATIAKTPTVAPSPCHMATQTTFEDNDLWNSIGDARRVSVVGSNGRCRLCSRVATHEKDEKHTRRRSCPPALASGARIKLGQEATVLLALIEQLKQQLAEEQQSRKILEQTIQQQLSSATLLSPSSSSHTRTSTS
ncbi:hypothetical protein BC940DRAFT_296098 [Gongronella butleri]|nr:hypothetical protein BC940DRAFT_296098 [Gongronella butleri]